MNGYWARGKKVIDISDSKHIIFLINNPDVFGIEKEEIEDIYKKHNEKLYSEGNAREELIKEVSSRGWVRIRQYKQYWSIQFHKYTKGIEDTVKNFVAWAMLSEKVMNKNDELRMTGYEDNYSAVYDFMNGGAGKYLSEQKEYDISDMQIVEWNNHKKIKEIFEEVLNESSLSRLVSKMETNDTGTITAFRNNYTREENMKRNKSLMAKLVSLRYRVTPVKGSFIENYQTSDAKEVRENVFFVDDFQKKGTLKKDLMKLGKEFEQESILFIPKTNIRKGKHTSFLIGVNKGYPGIGVEKELPILKIGKEAEFMTKVNGRPFSFEENGLLEEVSAGNVYGYYGASLEAKKDWKEL